jgi:4-hydroxybenzoate polyprenyltransferase
MTCSERTDIGSNGGRTREKGFLRIFAMVGRLHITAIAALGVFTFGWLFTGDYPWFLTGVCAFDWFFVNLINRIVDLKEDEVNAITGTEFLAKHRKHLIVVGFILLIVSLVVVHLLNPAITGLRVTCHFMGVLYNWPLLRGKRRLKEQYFWKNMASAIGFLLTVFGYPLATLTWEKGFHSFPPGITWATVFFSALFFLLFVLSYEVIYDLRDVRGDTLAGIRTYPVVHGEQTAVRIVDGFIFSSILVLTAGYGSGFVPWRIFIMVGAPVIQYAVYKHALRRGISAKDCTFITWMGVVLFLIYHLWVLAELPGTRL